MSGSLVVLAVVWSLLAGPGGTDAGADPHLLPPRSAEDTEVLENLELLEQLDAATDLELLRELGESE
jgi:hypothetical protein